MTTWEELRPFHHIWGLDFEFRQPPGHQPTVHCMVAEDFLHGTIFRLPANALRQGCPPFDVRDGIFIAYGAIAELACFHALHWPIPRYWIDLLVEHTRHTSGVVTKDGKRIGRKLYEALFYFNLSSGDAVEKKAMQTLAMRGGPFTPNEMQELLEYCASDVACLKRLLPALLPHFDLVPALVRGQHVQDDAQMSQWGIPLDEAVHDKLLDEERWARCRQVVITEAHRRYGIFPHGHFSNERFDAAIRYLNVPWELTPKTGHCLTDKEYVKQQVRLYPALTDLADALTFYRQLKTFTLGRGDDDRTRAPLWPYSTKTARHAPSSTEFIFGLPAWLRSQIQPRPSYGLIYADYCQEEPGIGACLSADTAMCRDYEQGDIYFAFAKRARAVPEDAIEEAHMDVRERFKVCLLASFYGQGGRSLSLKIHQPRAHAAFLLRQLAWAYPEFHLWLLYQRQRAYHRHLIESRMDWRMRVDHDTRATTLLNWPMQTTGSEILYRAVRLLIKHGLRPIAPIHDAVLLEARLDELEDVARYALELMEQASRDILNGFTIRAEAKVIRYPQHYVDKRGRYMWDILQSILQLDQQFLDDIHDPSTEKIVLHRC
jgi:DNA polymerase-1